MNTDQPGPAPAPLGASRNALGGTVSGSVVQAGRIHGDVTIGLAQPAAARVPVPAQLPPAPANFTNRVAELALLDGVLAKPDPVRRLAVAVLAGGGGAGKTSLGAAWLHRGADRYEGGALYADLKGHEPAAAARPADVLTGFLRALGAPPAQMPLALDELAALFRTLTSGRRVLILLDNAASAAQVRALLPGPGPRDDTGDRGQPSVVLVTTRWRLAGLATEGARFIDVGPLDEESAVALFTRVTGAGRVAAEPDAARSVVRMCAGLPLALCVSAALAVSRPRRPITRLAADLSEQQRRLAALTADDLSVSSAFDTTYRALPAAVARGYRMLPAIPGPDFTPGAAAACIGGDAGEARDLLDALTGASLLQETGDQRFRYHDLAKLHALAQGRAEPDGELSAAAARAITWYLEQAVAADLVVIPGRWRLNPMYDQARVKPPAFARPGEALAWLETEQDCLCDAVTAARGLGLFALSWQLCEALWGLFANRNYFRPWIQTHQMGIAAAHSDGSRRAEARVRVQLGVAYRHLHRFADAREQYALALTLDQAEGHRLGEATELEQLGLTDLAEGRPGEAVGAFSRARAIFRETGRPRGAAMMTCHIGEAHRDAGRYGEAIRDLTEARGMFASLPDAYNEARAVAELGRAYLSAGEPGEAGRLLTWALDAMAALDSPYEQARIRVFLADIEIRAGHAGAARRHLELALAVYDALGAPEARHVRLELSGLAGEPGIPGSSPGAVQ